MKPTIVGDHKFFEFTGLDDAGNPEDITGHTITFKAYDAVGNAITKTVGDGIVLYTQSGATLGRAQIAIVPTDYPVAWKALRPKQEKKIDIEIERIDGSGILRSTKGEPWLIEGQGIVTNHVGVFSEEFSEPFA